MSLSSLSVPDGLTRRPATDSDADMALLSHLYATTRADELAMTPWSDAQKELFARQQFYAQHTYYHKTWPDAAYDIVELHGEPIGRIYVDLRPGAVQLMEITLLPELRGRGLGTALIQQVIAQADRLEQPVSLFVEAHNPAQRLYARLGFHFTENHGIYQLLIRPYR
ncbi:GNAT family N-acetyltransferase [Armatimonas sp.]|uniref:GNAT family N-acetyltransferase n=1 Tax=Armatimonas sp. TaxID=1872638 RepID=UPI00375047B4